MKSSKIIDGVEWHKHDGGKCPVPGNTMVAVPAGTYASKSCEMRFRADSTEWESDKVFHLRDEIQYYRIVGL